MFNNHAANDTIGCWHVHPLVGSRQTESVSACLISHQMPNTVLELLSPCLHQLEGSWPLCRIPAQVACTRQVHRGRVPFDKGRSVCVCIICSCSNPIQSKNRISCEDARSKGFHKEAVTLSRLLLTGWSSQ